MADTAPPASAGVDEHDFDLYKRYTELYTAAVSGGSPRAAASFLSLVRSNSHLCHAPHIAAAADVALSSPSSLGDDKWPILEQSVASRLVLGDIASAAASLAPLRARFLPPASPTSPVDFTLGSARVRRLEGMLLEAVGELDAARFLYESILSSHPTHVPTLTRLVAIQLETKGGQGLKSSAPRDVKGALSSLYAWQALCATSGSDATPWLQCFELLTSTGSLPQACFALEEALLITPARPELHARLASVMASRGLHQGDAATQLPLARLHACEALRACVQVQPGPLHAAATAYAASVLADVAFMHVLSLTMPKGAAMTPSHPTLKACVTVVTTSASPTVQVVHAYADAVRAATAAEEGADDDASLSQAALESALNEAGRESVALHAHAVSVVRDMATATAGGGAIPLNDAFPFHAIGAACVSPAHVARLRAQSAAIAKLVRERSAAAAAAAAR